MDSSELKKCVKKEMSDIIVGMPSINCWRNLTSGAIGGLEAVKRDKPWIYLDYEKLTNVRGVYTYEEEADGNSKLHIAVHKPIAENFSCRWEFYKEIVIEKDNKGQPFTQDNENPLDGSIIVGIRGDSITYEQKDKNGCLFAISFFGEEGRAIRKFFGGAVSCVEGEDVIDEIYPFFGGDSLNDFIFKLIEDDSRYNFMLYGRRDYNMEDINFKKKGLPDSVTKMFEGFSKKMLSTENYWRFEHFLREGLVFSILDRQEKDYILRSFVAGPNNNNGNLEFCEFERIGINGGMDKGLAHLSHAFIWYDKEGIGNGPFAYTQDLLDKAVGCSMGFLNKIVNGIIFGEIYMDSSDIFAVAYAAAFSPTCEKLIRSKNEVITEECIDIIINSCDSLKCTLTESFGLVDESKEPLHQALGIPKRMFNIFIEKCEDRWVVAVRTCKDIFLSAPEYLANMCDKDANILSKYITDYIDDNGMCGTEINILKKMIFLFGPGNFKKMADYVFNMRCEKRPRLERYIDIISGLYMSGVRSDFKWKFKKDGDIEKEIKKWQDAYDNLASPGAYVFNREAFKRYEKDWEKYEYVNNGYMVTYPKSPEEVIQEGAALHHCVKTFLTNISTGITTILFLRSCENPDKPYFTMEVKNGILKQCHGFDNCDISSGFPGMEEFIVDFCREKKLEFNAGNEAYGADNVV